MLLSDVQIFDNINGKPLPINAAFRAFSVPVNAISKTSAILFFKLIFQNAGIGGQVSLTATIQVPAIYSFANTPNPSQLSATCNLNNGIGWVKFSISYDPNSIGADSTRILFNGSETNDPTSIFSSQCSITRK